MTHKRFEKFAWGFLAYLVAVILFGAWVRISHSGAGCGSHWPTCNGEIVPLEPTINTLIEFTHRITSGLCGVFGLAMVVWAWHLSGSGAIFRASLATLFFILVEGAIGAGLVLRELVADDDSVARAIVVALHLSNTLLLTASATLAAWLARGKAMPALGRMPARFTLALIRLIATSMTGAVAALGDTLFPIEPTLGPGLIDKVSDDLSAANHFLVRLRAVHPVVAIFAGFYVCWLLLPVVREGAAPVKAWASAGLYLALAELLLGALNVALAAPGWLQIIHLLMAHSLWICILLATVESFASDSELGENGISAARLAARAAPLLLIALSADASQPWNLHVIDDTSEGADGVRLADVNHDGLMDITTGWEQGNVVRIYLNPGPTKAKKRWPSVTVGSVPAPEDAVFADLNGDGATDVVSSTEGRSRNVFVHWAPRDPARYLDASAWETAALPASLGRQQWMFILPLDADGQHSIDFVVG